MNDCSQTKTLLMLAADGELDLEQIAWLERHVESCAACRAEQMRFRALDRDLCAYGDLLVRQNPPGAGRVTAPRRRVRATIIRFPRVAAGLKVTAALAAVLVLGVILVRTRPPEHPIAAIDETFVPIPYVQPLDPYESATVMRMEVPVAALIAAGYQVDMVDPTAVVKADVLVGEDGRAHAIRLLSILVMKSGE